MGQRTLAHTHPQRSAPARFLETQCPDINRYRNRSQWISRERDVIPNWMGDLSEDLSPPLFSSGSLLLSPSFARLFRKRR
jgi:hypothetical protein